MSNNDNNKSGGIIGGCGFCSLLTIAFIVLKLCGQINWSWVWVLAPLWISTLLYILLLVVVIVFLSRKDKRDWEFYSKKNRRR